MKRTLALVCSAVLALAISPLAATAETPPNDAAATSNVSTPESRLIDFGGGKKKCSRLCVQSTLPEAQIDTFFANDNRDLISVNFATVTRRNLDTRKVTDTEPAPGGVEFIKAATSDDRDEIYVVGNHSTQGIKVYRVDTSNPTTLELVDVTPSSPTYEFGYGELAVLPDNTGYLVTVFDNAGKYLCRYSETGVEVGCSSSFSSGGQSTSHLFFHYTGDYVYAVGADNKLFEFDIRDMTFTSSTLAGFDFEIGESAYADTYIWIAENLGVLDGEVTRLVQISTVSNSVVGTYDLPAETSVMSLDARPYGLTIVGRPFDSAGQPENFSTVYSVNLYPDFDLVKTIKIKNSRYSQGLSSVTVDDGYRYALVAGGGMKTSVIPTQGAGITTTAEYHTCPVGWTITWDFLNLQLGKPVKAYDVLVKKDVPRATWVKVGSVATGSEHTYELTAAEVGDEVKVVPRKIKTPLYNTRTLEETPLIPVMGRSAARQPRC